MSTQPIPLPVQRRLDTPSADQYPAAARTRTRVAAVMVFSGFAVGVLAIAHAVGGLTWI
jgi:hypothetical protein